MSAVEITVGTRTLTATIEGTKVVLEGSSFTVEAVGGGFYQVTDGDKQWTVAVAGPLDDRWVFIDGQVAQVTIDATSPKAAGASPRRRSGTPDLSSPMPATVIRLLVKPGDRVARGDTLIVLEAMKMELPIRAARDAVVRAVHCKPGQLVQPGLALLELE